jgi:hypothetical protein
MINRRNAIKLCLTAQPGIQVARLGVPDLARGSSVGVR